MEFYQGLESSAVYTAHCFCVETHHGRLNLSQPNLLLDMPAEPNIPSFITSILGYALPKPSH